MAWTSFNNEGIWDDSNQLVIPNGLYVIRSEPDDNKPWVHSAILDVGNTTERVQKDTIGEKGMRYYNSENNAYQPFVLHLGRNGLQIPLISSYLNIHPNTEVIANISGIVGEASARMEEFINKYGQAYSGFFNNCEHFTSYVVTGKKESPTLQDASTTALFAGLVGIQVLPHAISLGKWLFGGKQGRA